MKYTWYSHNCFDKDFQNQINTIILNHDFKSFCNYYKAYNAWSLSNAQIHNGKLDYDVFFPDKESNGLTYILEENNFNLITEVEVKN